LAAAAGLLLQEDTRKRCGVEGFAAAAASQQPRDSCARLLETRSSGIERGGRADEVAYPFEIIDRVAR
jgi:hypothetical protein